MPHTPNASTPRSVHRFVLCVFITLALVASSSFAGAQDKLPSWTNTSGKTIQADFISLDGDSLEIQKDGKRFKIDLNTLSEASQRQAKDFARKAATPLPQPSNFPSQLSLCLEFLGTASLGADNSLTVRQPFFDPNQGPVKRWVKRNRKAMGRMVPYLEEQTFQIRNGKLLGHYVSVVPVEKCYCFFLDGTPVKDHSQYFSQRPKTVLVAKQIGRNETQETAKTQAEKYLEMLDPFYRTVLRKDLVILVLPNKMGDKWLFPKFEPVALPESESQEQARKLAQPQQQGKSGLSQEQLSTTKELEDRFIATVKRNKDLNNNFKTASDTFEAVEFLAGKPEKLSYYFDEILEIERPDQGFERVRESLKRVGEYEYGEEREILLIGGAAADLSAQVAFNRELRKKEPIDNSVEEEYRSILLDVLGQFQKNPKIAQILSRDAESNKPKTDLENELDSELFVVGGHQIRVNVTEEFCKFDPQKYRDIDLLNVSASTILRELASKGFFTSIRYSQGGDDGRIETRSVRVTLDAGEKTQQVFDVDLSGVSAVDAPTVLLKSVTGQLTTSGSIEAAPIDRVIDVVESHRKGVELLKELVATPAFEPNGFPAPEYSEVMNKINMLLSKEISKSNQTSGRCFGFLQKYFRTKGFVKLIGDDFLRMDSRKAGAAKVSAGKKGVKLEPFPAIDEFIVNYHRLINGKRNSK